MLRKKAINFVQDIIPPPIMYIHMCTLYTYTNTYMSRFSPSGFFGPSRCLIPTPGLTSQYPICAECLCVCVYTPTQIRTLPPALKTEMTQTTPLSLLASIHPRWCGINSADLQQAHITSTERPRSAILVSPHFEVVIFLYSPQKMHMHPCMSAYATVQKLLRHGSYCKLILRLA